MSNRGHRLAIVSLLAILLVSCSTSSSGPGNNNGLDAAVPSDSSPEQDGALTSDADVSGATCTATAAVGYYCGGAFVEGGQESILYYCAGPGPAQVQVECAQSCIAVPGADDYCGEVDAMCDSNASTGLYCAGNEVTDGVTDTLYSCAGPGPATVQEACEHGCVVAPAGSDDYCAAAPSATCDANASTGLYCAGDKVSGGATGTLYHCNGPGAATVEEVCADGCVVAPAGSDDYCAAAGATCDSNAGTGYYCAGDKVSGGSTNTLYYCTGPGPATVQQVCAHGCVVAPAGSDDYCSSGGSTGYRLPFACGTSRTCSNGNHTSSHSGTDEYAYDFAMPVGTSVRAIRGGVVHRVRIVSTPGSACYNGGGSSCANYANTVEVRHSDGTIGLYMHISRSTVSTGQTVSQGQEVAKSGNTGWSTGPHLHLQVQSNCGIWWCQSRLFHFVEAPSLSTGQTVTSQNCP